MEVKDLMKLEEKILALLTDKNVGKIKAEGEQEEFGALMAYSTAFKEVSKVFNDEIVACLPF